MELELSLLGNGLWTSSKANSASQLRVFIFFPFQALWRSSQLFSNPIPLQMVSLSASPFNILFLELRFAAFAILSFFVFIFPPVLSPNNRTWEARVKSSMSLQLKPIHHHFHHRGGRHCHSHQPYQPSFSVIHSFISLLPNFHLLNGKRGVSTEGSVRPLGLLNDRSGGGGGIGYRSIVASGIGGAPISDVSKPDKGFVSPPLSDILWPSAGAFAAMAMLGKMDQILAPKGLSMTIAPLGAVCAILFTAPSSPAARKYNMFMAQIGCAAIGVLAFTLLGPGWLARSSALAASMAFMIYTGSTHPPAASLPLVFIDGAKMQQLNFWYALFPGAAGCILLCFIQEIVVYLKEKFKF